jgi:hypothetical protein
MLRCAVKNGGKRGARHFGAPTRVDDLDIVLDAILDCSDSTRRSTADCTISERDNPCSPHHTNDTDRIIALPSNDASHMRAVTSHVRSVTTGNRCWIAIAIGKIPAHDVVRLRIPVIRIIVYTVRPTPVARKLQQISRIDVVIIVGIGHLAAVVRMVQIAKTDEQVAVGINQV